MQRLIVRSSLAIALALAVAAGSSADASAPRYAVHVVNSPAGGDPGYFYVGGPINVTVRDRRHRHERFRMCMVPPPLDRDSCMLGRTDRPITSIAPSLPGRTKLRVTLPHKVLVRTIVIRAAG